MAGKMKDNYQMLESVVRDSYASIVWSHKIQEKQSDIYSDMYKGLETAKILLSAITSGGIIALIFTNTFWLKLITAMISVITVFINGYFKSFDLQKSISTHKQTANRLIIVRDQYKVLLTKIKMRSESAEHLLLEYQKLIEESDNIYLEAPSTTSKAVDKASKALKITKDNTFLDDEIDSFLPRGLKKDNYDS